MPIYEITADHRPDDQVFSYYHHGKLLHFNVSLLNRLREQMPKEFRRITMDITDAEYRLVMEHRGIEEPKVKALTPKQLREPGLMVMFEQDGTVSIVDGHHRLARRYRGGVRVMDFYVTHETIWRVCLVDYPPELESLLAEEIPPEVEMPAMLASSVRFSDD
jgi:hypothetical protein